MAEPEEESTETPQADTEATAQEQDDAKIAKWMQGESQGEDEAKQPAEEEVAEGDGVQDKAGEPEEADGKEQESGEPAAGQPEEVDIKDMLDDEGNIDLEKVRKFKKSYTEAQKLVGKTAKDREKLKLLPQIEQEAAHYREFDRIFRSSPEVQQAVQQAVARERGMSVPAAPKKQPENPAVDEDAEKKISELMRAGKYAEANRLSLRTSPEFQEFQEYKARLEQERAERQRLAQLDAIARERDEFEKEYEGVLFGPKKADNTRDILDQELYDAFYAEVNDHTPFKKAFAVAAFNLGRTPVSNKKTNTTPAKPSGAKAQAMQTARGTKPTQPSKPSKGDDWMGLNPKNIDSLLKR